VARLFIKKTASLSLKLLAFFEGYVCLRRRYTDKGIRVDGGPSGRGSGSLSNGVRRRGRSGGDGARERCISRALSRLLLLQL
jgi:hypothetical protein